MLSPFAGAVIPFVGFSFLELLVGLPFFFGFPAVPLDDFLEALGFVDFDVLHSFLPLGFLFAVITVPPA